MNLWGRLWDWFALRRVLEAQRRANQWQVEAGKNLWLLERRTKRLTALQRRLTSINDTTLEDLEECRGLMDKHAGIVDGLNAELEILRDITVPGLTEAHQGLVDRIQAERADQKRRQVLALPPEEEMR